MLHHVLLLQTKRNSAQYSALVMLRSDTHMRNRICIFHLYFLYQWPLVKPFSASVRRCHLPPWDPWVCINANTKVSNSEDRTERGSNFIVFQESVPGMRAKYSWSEMKEILFLGKLSSHQGPRAWS